MTIANEIAALLDIADRAVQLHDAEKGRRATRSDLNTAYNRWKSENGIDHVVRDTPDWDGMMAATKPEFENFEQAKRRERNARKRLSDAVSRHVRNS